MDDARNSNNKLQDSELMVRMLFESAPQGILAINADGRVVLANTMVEKMFGYSANELIDYPLEHLIPENSKQPHQEHQKAFFANPKKRPMGIGVDLEGQRKDGTRFPIEVGLSYVDASDGTLGVAFVSDITARKNAEEFLHRSELHHRELMEHMHEGLAYCRMLFENGLGSDFVYIMVNDRFEILTGLRDVAGKRVTEVIPRIRELDPDLLEIYARVSLTGSSEKFEMFLNSLQQWYLVSVYSPEKGFFVAIFDVIDERKRTEYLLHKREIELGALSSNAQDVVVRFDRDLRYTYVNARTEKETGLQQKTMVGKTPGELAIPEAVANLVTRSVRRVFETGLPSVTELSYPSPGGVTHWEASFIPEFVEKGEVRSVLNVARDITEKLSLIHISEPTRPY